VIGFCSGGRRAYLVTCKLAHLIQAAVDCWGGNVVVDDESRLTKAQPTAPIDLPEGINCPVLGLFGNEHPNPTADQVNRIEGELSGAARITNFTAMTAQVTPSSPDIGRIAGPSRRSTAGTRSLPSFTSISARRLADFGASGPAR
jgi:dienelactone hydrolase